jgi:hypothetical protein
MIRHFTDVTSSYWYDENVQSTNGHVYEIAFGLLNKEGDGMLFEAMMRWYNLNNKDGKLSARLEVFQDTWAIFEHLPDVFASLAKLGKSNPQPEDFKCLLYSMGFMDKTEYVKDKEENKKVILANKRKSKIRSLDL